MKTVSQDMKAYGVDEDMIRDNVKEKNTSN